MIYYNSVFLHYHCYFYLSKGDLNTSEYLNTLHCSSLLCNYLIGISIYSMVTIIRLYSQLPWIVHDVYGQQRDWPSWDETAKLDRMIKQRYEVICGSVQAETQTCILLQSSLGGMRKPPHSFIHGVSWEKGAHMKDINWKRGQFHLTLLNHGQWWRLRCLVLSRQLACKLKFYYNTFMNVLLVSKLQRIHILVTIRNKCWRVNLLSMLNTIEPAVYIDSFWSVSIANQFRRCRPI